MLANRIRLRVFHCVLKRPDRSVSEVAKEVKVSHPVASLYLRALNARGLLKVKRVGRWVLYRAGADDTIPDTKRLLDALAGTFADERNAADTIFRLATAFTHPRRQEIYQALAKSGLTIDQLRASTGISKDALRRHLKKLESRRFVVVEKETYRTAIPEGVLAKTLAHLAQH